MIHFFSLHLAWLLLIPAALAMVFMIWVLVNLARDRERRRRRTTEVVPLPEVKTGTWD